MHVPASVRARAEVLLMRSTVAMLSVKATAPLASMIRTKPESIMRSIGRSCASNTRHAMPMRRPQGGAM